MYVKEFERNKINFTKVDYSFTYLWFFTFNSFFNFLVITERTLNKTPKRRTIYHKTNVSVGSVSLEILLT